MSQLRAPAHRHVPEGDTVLRTARRLDQALAGRPLVRPNCAGRPWARPTWPGARSPRWWRTANRSSPGSPRPTRRRRSRAFPTVPPWPLTLRSHLRMEGRWYVHARDAEPWPPRNRASVRAVLGGTEWTAVGTWLGLLDLIPTAAEPTLIGHLGPGHHGRRLRPDGAAEAVRRLLADPARHVGAALLDQTTVAGIGTMYMAEALFVQKVSPWTPIGEVDVPALLATARRLLLRGATQAIPTTTGNPRTGHGQLGARPVRPACQRCGTTLRVAPIGPPLKERTGVLLPELPARTDAHRRRQAPQPARGRTPAVRGESPADPATAGR